MATSLPPVREVDVERHGGEQAPSQPVPKPDLGSSFELDEAVVEALPVPGTKIVSARHYGMSLWGKTGKITTVLPGGAEKSYFLKTVSLEDAGRMMMEGEFESLRAIHAVCPNLAPCVYCWGKFKNKTPSGSNTHFLLADYRNVGEQPPEPTKFTARLAELHRESESPTGKFGFHITTCHAKLPQDTNCWEESWAVLYRKQLARMLDLDREKHGDWTEFTSVSRLVLDQVIPRILEPLQSCGRSIKPCLIHGDLWDENCAADGDTDEPFIFDAGSFYAHNEYEIGNWRAARHRLSRNVYVENYKRNFPPSE